MFMVVFIELMGGCLGLVMVTFMEGKFSCDSVANCLIACLTFGSVDNNRVNATNASIHNRNMQNQQQNGGHNNSYQQQNQPMSH